MIRLRVNDILGSRCIVCQSHYDLYVVSIKRDGNLLSDIDRAIDILTDPNTAKIKYALVCGECGVLSTRYDDHCKTKQRRHIYV